VELHQAYSIALQELPRYLSRIGYSQYGLPVLREAIARRYSDRGLHTSADQIYISSGALHGLGLVARLLLRPHDRVVTDLPTYPHALDLFRSLSCRVSSVAVTDGGWDLKSLREASHGASLAYLIPDFHNPTGLCLSQDGRAALRLDCPVVIDETMSELALDVTKPAPFAAHHIDAISIGSASKTFWGGLRVGWIRGPVSLISKLAQVRTKTDLGTSVVDQLACAELMNNVDATLPQRLHTLRNQRELMRSLINDRLPGWQLSAAVGGLSFWARLPKPVSSAIASVAPYHGLRVAAGPRFGTAGTLEHYIRLPYSLDESLIEQGVAALVDAYAEVLSGQRRQSPSAPVI
jgi:DNA-binding transcriptional MocR family regulator